MQQQPQVNLDLTKTTPVDLPSGGKIWQSGVILRRVSKFVTGTSEDGLIPIPIFYDPETNEIMYAKFKTFGCGSAIASSSLATEWVKGKSIEEAMSIQNTEIVEELSLPPVKIHCSVLAEDAIKAAISDYKSRNED